MSGGQGGARGPPQLRSRRHESPRTHGRSSTRSCPSSAGTLGLPGCPSRGLRGAMGWALLSGNPSPRNGTQTGLEERCWGHRVAGEVARVHSRGALGMQRVTRAPGSQKAGGGRAFLAQRAGPSRWRWLRLQVARSGERGGRGEQDTPPRRDARGRGQVDVAVLGGA